jgi:hypothetical protein
MVTTLGGNARIHISSNNNNKKKKLGHQFKKKDYAMVRVPWSSKGSLRWMYLRQSTTTSFLVCQSSLSIPEQVISDNESWTAAFLPTAFDPHYASRTLCDSSSSIGSKSKIKSAPYQHCATSTVDDKAEPCVYTSARSVHSLGSPATTSSSQSARVGSPKRSASSAS